MKNEFKALMMKMDVMFNIVDGKIDYKNHNIYSVTRKMIDLIEKTNNQKLETKMKLTLIKGDAPDAG